MNEDHRRLLKTGWQSWSVSNRRFLRMPRFNYNPKADDFYSEVKNTHRKNPVRGWCSWYAFGKNITHEKVLAQMSAFKQKKISITHILIDDGWTVWGDWNTNNTSKFPNGMKATATAIRKQGFKPGIWIAPFLVDMHSQLVKKHPDWIATKHAVWSPDGEKMNVGILDIRKSEVQKHIREATDDIIRKGYDLVKLDFLYVPYFIPELSGKEAGAFLHSYLAAIRKQHPETYFIACGCPLTPAIGIIDSMRIGPDIIIPTKPSLKTKLYNLFSIRAIVRNIDKRKWTRAFWNIDADAYVCDAKQGFSDKNLFLLQRKIRETKGDIFLGDDITKLSDEQINRFIRPLLAK